MTRKMSIGTLKNGIGIAVAKLLSASRKVSINQKLNN